MPYLQSFSALAFVLVASVFVHASPIAQNEEQDSTAVIDCGGGYRFTKAAQDKGYDDAIAHLNARPPTQGKGSNQKLYPEYYGDMPPVVGIPASCKQNYNDLQIYPVFVQETTTFTDGSAPGSDRVVISRHTDGEKERCGLITHRGAAAGQFKWCI